jgi:hypothetical protein
MDFNKPERINDKALEILQKRFDKVEPKFVKQVVDWISKFRTTSGNLVRSKENIARLSSFKTAVNRFLEKANYNVMVSGFLENFDEIGANTQLAQQELNGLDITKSFLNPFKRYAVNNVVAAMQGQGLNVNLINPLKNELLIAVNQGSSLTDVVTSIAGQLTTTEARQGVLKRISLQASRDALLQYDGVVNEAVRKSYKMDALLYVGSIVKDSRAQCERWVSETKNGKLGLILFEDLQSEIDWADNNGTGMIPDTTPENFCQNRGGFNCRHIAYPVRSANYIKEEKPKEPEVTKEPEEPKFVEAKNINEIENRLQNLTISNNKIDLKNVEIEVANSVLQKVEEYANKNVKIYDIKVVNEPAAFALNGDNELLICRQAKLDTSEKSLNIQIANNKWYNAGARLAVSDKDKLKSFIDYNIEHEFNHAEHFKLIAASLGGYGDEFTKESKKWNNEWNKYISQIHRKENEWHPSDYVKRFVNERDFTKEWLAESLLYYKHNKNLIKDDKILNLLDSFVNIVNKLNKI